MSVADGHWTPGGANIRNPAHVPATIIASRKADTNVVNTTVRVMIQCRASGRARIKSMNPVSTSDVGTVASVTASAISAPMTASFEISHAHDSAKRHDNRNTTDPAAPARTAARAR